MSKRILLLEIFLLRNPVEGNLIFQATNVAANIFLLLLQMPLSPGRFICLQFKDVIRYKKMAHYIRSKATF